MLMDCMEEEMKMYFYQFTEFDRFFIQFMVLICLLLYHVYVL